MVGICIWYQVSYPSTRYLLPFRLLHTTYDATSHTHRVLIYETKSHHNGTIRFVDCSSLFIDSKGYTIRRSREREKMTVFTLLFFLLLSLCCLDEFGIRTSTHVAADPPVGNADPWRDQRTNSFSGFWYTGVRTPETDYDTLHPFQENKVDNNKISFP